MSATKLTVTALKKHLRNASKAELVEQIADLYQRFNGVKDFYQLQLAPGQAEVVQEKYAGVIKAEFFPERGDGFASLSAFSKC